MALRLAIVFNKMPTRYVTSQPNLCSYELVVCLLSCCLRLPSVGQDVLILGRRLYQDLSSYKYAKSLARALLPAMRPTCSISSLKCWQIVECIFPPRNSGVQRVPASSRYDGSSQIRGSRAESWLANASQLNMYMLSHLNDIFCNEKRCRARGSGKRNMFDVIGFDSWTKQLCSQDVRLDHRIIDLRTASSQKLSKMTHLAAGLFLPGSSCERQLAFSKIASAVYAAQEDRAPVSCKRLYACVLFM